MNYLLGFIRLLLVFIGFAGASMGPLSLLAYGYSGWLALLCFILSIPIAMYGMYGGSKECPKCGSICGQTGVRGEQYKQWYCSKCNKTFWTTLFTHDYE